MADIDIATADSSEIYAASKAMNDKEIKAVMASENRGRVLDAMVDHMAAGFNADKAGDLDAIIHVKVWDAPDGGYDHYELVIHDGTCKRSKKPGEEADLTIKAGPVDLRNLVTGKSNAKMMAIRRKLTVQGDIKLGLRLGDLFGI